MRLHLFSLLGLVFSPLALGGSLDLPVERHTLSNGLPVLLHPDRSTPILTFQIFYRCGARNEVPGLTGLSHLLEHMMFNGSTAYPPKAFDNLLEAAGGASNGYTWKDFTAYMETFPPEALGLVLSMEADRMRGLSLTEASLSQERGIVAEERRYSIENDNDGVMQETLENLMFQAYPYRNPEVGWMGDIESFQLADLRAYYDRCYVPANAVIVVAGDMETGPTLQAIEKAFGAIPSGRPVQPPTWSEPPQEGLRYAELTRPSGGTRLRIGFRAPAAASPESAVFDLVEHVLTDGRASLLVDLLVYQQALLVDVSSTYVALEKAGLLVIDASLAEGVSTVEAEDAIHGVLQSLGDGPLPPERLERARRQAEMSLYGQLGTVAGKADLVGTFEVLRGGFEAISRLPEAWSAVTPEVLRTTSATWLQDDQRSVVALYPDAAPAETEEGGAP